MSRPLGTVHATFRNDDVVAGRFRIVRYLARGGMGEVYEATDELLHTRVALKTLRAHVAEEPEVLERFRREIVFARKVTHPNVCRVFDVFEHAAGDRQPALVVFTMELLPGETLGDRLQKRGRLPCAEALPIVEQLVAALSAAHQAGVVHRDLKSANVMLVPGTEGGERVVVTDFGLARAAHADSDGSGTAMVGTSAYMAPEQVDGGAITPATDIYALGVVMYEMTTGRRPFEGDTPAAVALSRLQQPAPSPRAFVSDLDASWERTIVRCLERRPEDRFRTAGEVLAALATPAADDGPPQVPAPMARRGRKMAALLAVAVVASAVTFIPYVPSRDTSRALGPGTATTARRPVAVLGFKSLSGRPESAWLSTALAEMLSTELAAASSLRTIPGENVTLMKADLALSDVESLGPQTLSRIRAYSGAEVVVLGSYLAVQSAEAALRVDLRVQDTSTGETLASIAETGTEGGILDLVGRCGSRLRAALGGREAGGELAAGSRRSWPGTPDAVRLYTQGLQQLRLFDPQGAIATLEDALREDPGFAMGRVALSQAWSTLGYDSIAHEQARLALEAARDLGEEERLLAEARYHETAHEWPQAVERYRMLFGLFPDDVEMGLRLLESQASGGLTADAEKTLAALRRLPLGTADRARIDLMEAALAQAVSDYERERRAASRAALRGEEAGVRLVVARARDLEAWALLRQGLPDDALVKYEEARRAFDATRDRSGLGRVTSSIGLVLRDRGEIDAARRHHEQALALFREVGDRGGTAWSLQHIGIVAEMEGDFTAARSAYEESLTTFREIADAAGSLLPVMRLGNLALLTADLPAARLRYEEALRASRAVGSKTNEARARHGLGDVLAAEGRTERARQAYRQALQLRASLGDRAAEAGSRLALAGLSFHQGRLDEAEAEGQQAAIAYETLRVAEGTALSRALLAQVHGARRRLEDAEQSLRAAQRSLHGSPRGPVAHRVALAAAEIAAARGRVDEARRELERLSAESVDLPALRLEAQIVLGALEISSGDAASGESRLRRCQDDAVRRGLGLLAQRASAARAGTRPAGASPPSQREPGPPRG